MHTHMPALAHRVSRPRGTGSVGDSVGYRDHSSPDETSDQHNSTDDTSLNTTGLMTPVYIGLAGVMLNYGTYMKRWCASRKSGASYRSALITLSSCRLLQDVSLSLATCPSPTLSPTDPVPRGLLTLCPGASSGP